MSLTEQREGIEAGRLDMFVDGAFAFILTLLLIGGDKIPDSTDKLLYMLGGVPAFAVCFFQIAFFWHGHVRWRKRCHSADSTGRWLSLLLVFFAMIFVYPLHMVYSGVFNSLSDFSSMNSGVMLTTLGISMSARNAAQRMPLHGSLWRAKKYAPRMARKSEQTVPVTATNTVLAM